MVLVYSTGPLENDLPNPSERVAARALNNGVEKVTVLWLAFALDGAKRLVDSARVTLGPQESALVVLRLNGAAQFEVEAQVEGLAAQETLVSAFGLDGEGRASPVHRVLHAEMTLLADPDPIDEA
ncbi:MAG: hypothetical protein ACOY94_28490 [Bacillota bacterium]